MSYMNDPREMTFNKESGVMMEQDNRREEIYQWGAMQVDLCDLPVDEYMRPLRVEVINGGSSPETGATLYTVTFVVDGKSVYTNKLQYGATIPFEVNAEKSGRNFIGWYYGSTQYQAGSTMPSRNLTLTAKYECEVSFAFNVDGEESVVSAYTVAYNSKLVNIPSTDMDGYKFIGWEPSIEENVIEHTKFIATFEKMGEAEIYYGVFVISSTTADSKIFNKEELKSFKTVSVEKCIDGTELTISMPADPILIKMNEDDASDEEFEAYENSHLYPSCFLIPSDVASEYRLSVKEAGYEKNFETDGVEIVINGISYLLYAFLNPDSMHAADIDLNWTYNVDLK